MNMQIQFINKQKNYFNGSKRSCKKLEWFIKTLIEQGIPVEQAFLYGSYARNEMRKESDIDVLLISDKIDSDDLRTIGRIYRLAYPIDPRIEPYLITKEKFLNDEISFIIDAVRKEGIEIKA